MFFMHHLLALFHHVLFYFSARWFRWFWWLCWFGWWWFWCFWTFWFFLSDKVFHFSNWVIEFICVWLYGIFKYTTENPRWTHFRDIFVGGFTFHGSIPGPPWTVHGPVVRWRHCRSLALIWLKHLLQWFILPNTVVAKKNGKSFIFLNLNLSR